MTSSALLHRRRKFTPDDLDRLARPALAVVVLVAALLIYHLTRGGSFSVDDWLWIAFRRGDDANTFLAPYNGHLSLVPIAIYRVMFATAGIGDFAAFRVLLVVIDAIVGLIFFLYARPRIGDFGALLLAALLLFLGPGWNNILQPFQIAWLIAVGSAVAALVVLDRRRSSADVLACLLIGLSLASTSVGVPLALGIAVEIALTRRRWRDAWIVIVPGLLYVVWAVHYHSSGIQLSAITQVPQNLFGTTAAGLAGDAGLSFVSPLDLTGQSLTFGIPLLVLACAGLIVRRRPGWDASRFLSLAVALSAFSLVTTLARSSHQPPFESRYMYVTCVLVALIVVELVRGVPVGIGARLSVAALAVVAIVSNYGILLSGGDYLRGIGTRADGGLGAIELDRGQVAPATPVSLFPLGSITAQQYFRATAGIGTPAYSASRLRTADPAGQAAADQQSLADRDVTFAAGAAGVPTGAVPTAEAVTGGSLRSDGSCLTFTPAPVQSPNTPSALTVRLFGGRVALSASSGPATVSARRFGAAFTGLGTVQPGGGATTSVTADRAPVPWHVRVQSLGQVRVCAVAGA